MRSQTDHLFFPELHAPHLHYFAKFQITFTPEVAPAQYLMASQSNEVADSLNVVSLQTIPDAGGIATANEVAPVDLALQYRTGLNPY